MLTYHNPNLLLSTNDFQTGVTTFRSPSNLAIVKYWGKYGVQLPRNPSISLTLSAAYTEMTLHFAPKASISNDIALDFYFENQPNEKFKTKLVKFLTSIADIFPFLTQLQLEIRSYNSFPHSAGIASSASSMSALALCLCDVERRLFGTLPTESEFLQKASFVARLGSGSACRSVYPTAAMWGALDSLPQASDLYAIPFADRLHPVFKTFHDDILIVSRSEKAVSSRAGHGLMEGNPYAENRYQQARQRTCDLIEALGTGDVVRFGEIAENEALTLHALMMCSEPSYTLMRPNSLAIIERVRAFRQDSHLPLYFSLDAGPNLHLLYPNTDAAPIRHFIEAELLSLCEERFWISDQNF